MERVISKSSSVLKDFPEPWRPPALLDQLRHARPLCGRQHLCIQSFWTLKWLRLVLCIHSKLDDVLISVVLILYSINVIHPGKRTILEMLMGIIKHNTYLTSMSMRK